LKPVEPKEINGDVLFREGQNLMVLLHFIICTTTSVYICILLIC